jgi:hypothetical protein
MALFKSTTALERSVERCSILVDLEACHLVVRMHCKQSKPRAPAVFIYVGARGEERPFPLVSSILSNAIVDSADIVKIHRLYIEECEMLQAVYDKSRAPNVLAGSARMLNDATTNFGPGQEEVTFGASSATFSVASATELDPRKCVLFVSFSVSQLLAHCELSSCSCCLSPHIYP